MDYTAVHKFGITCHMNNFFCFMVKSGTHHIYHTSEIKLRMTSSRKVLEVANYCNIICDVFNSYVDIFNKKM